MTDHSPDADDALLDAQIRDYFADRCAAAGVVPFEVQLRRAQQCQQGRPEPAADRRRAETSVELLRPRRVGWAMAAGLAAAVLVTSGVWRAADDGPAPTDLASAALTGQLAASTWWQAPSDRLLGSQLGRSPAPVPHLQPPTLAPQQLPMDRIRTGVQGG